MRGDAARSSKRIQELAPVIHSPTGKDVVAVKSSDESAPIDILVKSRGGATSIFAVSMS